MCVSLRLCWFGCFSVCVFACLFACSVWSFVVPIDVRVRLGSCSLDVLFVCSFVLLRLIAVFCLCVFWCLVFVSGRVFVGVFVWLCVRWVV